jgi:hypothetical protein
MLTAIKKLLAGKPHLTDEQVIRYFVIEEEPAGSGKFAVYFQVGLNRTLIGGPLASQGTETSYQGAQLRVMTMTRLLQHFVRDVEE